MNHSFELSLNDLKALSMSVHTVLKAGATKEPDMKENSLEFKILATNKAIQEKLNTAAKLFELNPDRASAGIELTRAEVKVAITTIVTIYTMQEATLKQYQALPDDHRAFAPEEGRRKSDYVGRLEGRMKEVESVANKLKEGL